MRSHLRKKFILISIALGIAMSTYAYGVTVPKALTDKEAAELLQTAHTLAEHRALAEYFHQRAQCLKKDEQLYLETAASYQKHPPRVDQYRSVSTSAYYLHLAGEAAALAKADEQLSKFQLQLATTPPAQK